MELSQKIKRNDIFGALVSSACAIHCILLPIFFVAKPIISSATHDHHHDDHDHAHHDHAHHEHSLWEYGLDGLFLILSLVAVIYTARNTGHLNMKWMLPIAWVLFAVGLFAEWSEYSAGIWLMYIGSAGLIIMHIQNYRYCQRCQNGISH